MLASHAAHAQLNVPWKQSQRATASSRSIPKSASAAVLAQVFAPSVLPKRRNHFQQNDEECGAAMPPRVFSLFGSDFPSGLSGRAERAAQHEYSVRDRDGAVPVDIGIAGPRQRIDQAHRISKDHHGIRNAYVPVAVRVARYGLLY